MTCESEGEAEQLETPVVSNATTSALLSLPRNYELSVAGTADMHRYF